MKKNPLFRPLAALCTVALLLLAGCGGGGGGGESPSTTPPGIPDTTPLGASSQYEQAVAGCSLDTQKKFVRSYLDEVYLWYNEIVDVNAAQYTGTTAIPDYFDALLVRTPDVNGLPKDRFSAVIPTSVAAAVLGGSVQSDVTGLLSDHTSYVPVVKTVTSPGGRLAGYIQFNAHEQGSQDDLITAFKQMQAAGVQDLVLDLRFNSGGYLYVAQAAASMITGPSSEGQVFEKLQYNNKRQAETESSALVFSGKVQFADDIPGVSKAQYPVGTPLPQLNLPRVFVLTSGRTCSASESIINSLRGIDVPVIRIGSTTCGKPYGFREKDNCGWAFFPIEFKGTNAKGFGDYTTGYAPTCKVQDSSTPGVTGSAGTSTDPLLAGAFTYMDSGACPAGTATGVQGAATPILASEQPTLPAWAGRRLR